jgi:hypothetical protein
MHPDLKTTGTSGFYFFPDSKTTSLLVTEGTAFSSHFKSSRRRLYSPGISSQAFVVRHYGYKGIYNEEKYLSSQYSYYNIYDAMRQVNAYKEEEFEGTVELLSYDDESGLTFLRKWEFQVEGFVNMDGDYEVENSGWERTKP